MSEAPMRPAYQHNGRDVSREHFYAVACDPRRSVVVEACAGAGKTWMLVSRILRALLAGVAPQEILAITFTRKAAGEMRHRLHQWLTEFSQLPVERLAQELARRGVPLPESSVQAPALRELHAHLLAQGRTVQIRTFHGWFAALLRNAPLAVLDQLGLPAGYELLEDDSRARALVWRRFHASVAADASASADFHASVAAYGRFQTQKALEAALSKRVEFALADREGVVKDSVKTLGEQFPAFGGVEEPAEFLLLPEVRDAFTMAARSLGAAKAPTFSECGARLETALGIGDLPAALDALLTKDQTPRKFGDKVVGIEQVREAQALALEIVDARVQQEAWLHHDRMSRLARRLLAEFAELKRERGWVDMNDIEQAAWVLLEDPVLSGWVQERLDAQVRQLLVDEFQDTNPLQWQALSAWLSGYAGAASAPGIFIVGDPKQSIYRFRRAEPQVFRAAQSFVRDGLGGDLLSCDHTHRNAQPVLDAVNTVMAQAQQDGQYEGFRTHTTESDSDSAVQSLPQIPRPPRQARAQAAAAEPLVWRDSLSQPRELPEERLVAVESGQAARWIASQVAAGTAPGDIMVLARKRDRLAALEDELRQLHVPAQQPEKADLCEAPEVMDVVALMDVLVSPSHDLSLARALKSPLFDAGDDALVHLALLSRRAREEGGPASWYELLARTPRPARLDEAALALPRWKELVDRLPPHDALEVIYEERAVVARFAAAAPAALRNMVAARLRALLGAALAINDGRYATPYSFVRAMKAGGMPAPHSVHVDAVSLLTVHGAKGLEAPIVLLLDTDAQPQRAESMGVIVDWPGESAAPRSFAFIASESRPPPCCAGAMAREAAEREREELNALYVAMTRAELQLVISSVEPRVPNPGSWWRRVSGCCEAIPAVEGAAMARQDAARFTLPGLPGEFIPQAPAGTAANAAPVDSLQARIGNALHRLLERHAGGEARFTDAQVQAVAREFALSPARAAEAAAMARQILAGEGAWAWDPARVDWQGNEVPLLHEGSPLRLDRLVRTVEGEWWVLDYKSRARPQEAQELTAQLQQYRAAVQACRPGSAVRAAFLTPQGKLVAVD